MSKEDNEFEGGGGANVGCGGSQQTRGAVRLCFPPDSHS